MTTCLPLQNHTSTNLSSTSSSTCNSKWGPYSSVRDFDANMAMILIVLVCATILALFLNAAARLVLRCLRRSSTPPSSREKVGGLAELPAPLVYTAGTELAGAREVAECAICLAEFVEGDRVTVLPACHHGFHAHCAEAWLVSQPSCPTCRASCRAPQLPHEEP